MGMIVLSGIAGAMMAIGAAAGAAPAELPIAGVVVFADRAEVERSGEAQVSRGPTRIDLEGLPWEIVETSLRIVPGDTGVRVQRVEVEPVFKRLIREDEAAALKEEVAAVKKKIHELSSHAQRLRGSLGFLESFSVSARPHDPDEAPPPIPLNPGVWMQVLDFVGGSMEDVSKELRQVNGEIENASQDLEVLSTKLERLSSKDVKRYKNVHVHLVSDREGKIPLKVTYMVTGPQWFPRYELRADVASGKIRLVAYGLVRQKTGEDWKGVHMTLSTVDLSTSAALPELATRRISPGGVMEIRPTVVVEEGGFNLLDRARRQAAVQTGMDVQAPNAVEFGRQQAIIMGFQDDLANERQRIAEIRDGTSVLRGSISSLTGKAAKAPSPRQKELQTGQFEERYGRIRDLYRNQKKALEQGDYDQFGRDNRVIEQIWKTLPKGGQIALKDIQQDAGRNVMMAQRLIRSRKLERDLIPPQRSAVGVDYRFDSLGSANVYSEGVLTRVPYLEVDVPVEYVYESAPVLKQLSYLVATGTNPLRRPLLSGPMAVFVGPDFVGESVLATTASGRELRFELGVDREVEIRRQIERVRDTSGFFVHSYNYEYNVTIYAINRKGRPVKMKVVDRMPYAKEDSGVKVKHAAVEPAPGSREEDYGLLGWDFELEPGAKRKMTFSYGLSHRTSLMILGREGGCTPW